jgi:tRNA-Thr(GGU) m(6)t(6)A37 methyltransferase TsaA
MEKKVENIVYRPIGIIHTPFKEVENMPIQPSGAAGIPGTVDLYPEFAEGLKDLDGFSHLILLYHFHESRRYKLIVTPFLDSEHRGVFATRAPKRPNPIGLSIVRLIRIRGSTLDIENVDILDGTPLLDIKPYVPEFDHQQTCRIGWLEQARGKVEKHRSDERFRNDQ